jgi:hypothetical protein
MAIVDKPICRQHLSSSLNSHAKGITHRHFLPGPNRNRHLHTHRQRTPHTHAHTNTQTHRHALTHACWHTKIFPLSLSQHTKTHRGSVRERRGGGQRKGGGGLGRERSSRHLYSLLIECSVTDWIDKYFNATECSWLCTIYISRLARVRRRGLQSTRNHLRSTPPWIRRGPGSPAPKQRRCI